MSDTTDSKAKQLRSRGDIELTFRVPADATIGERPVLRVLQELSQRQLVVLPESPLYPTGAAAARCIELMCRSNPGPAYSKSLGRGLAVLACFGLDGVAEEGRVMLGVTEISKLLGMDITTTGRYLVTLVEHRLLVKDPVSRKYMPPWVAFETN